MKETKRYIQIQTIARQLCDIMQQHELKDIGELKEWLEHKQYCNRNYQVING